MKKTLHLSLLVALVVVVSATIAWNHYYSPEAKRSRLAREFVTVMPDTLTDMHRQEVINLLELFWTEFDRERVDPKDAEEIMQKLEKYVEAGHITPTDLVYFMAQVGYYTRKLDPRYNLPGGEVDHPVLNPASAVYVVPSIDSIRAIRDTTLNKKSPN